MSAAIAVIRDLDALRAQVAAWRKTGETIALVPTMGALHEGHLELVRLAKSKCSRAVVSIFVNPAQFAPHEDFDRYPRDEAGDLAKLKSVGCDRVWSPARSLMYPETFATRIVPSGAAEGLESDFRPHFFGGVATVCCKLFTQVAPDIAVFGEKDFQQLAVVTQMVRDLDLPLQIVALPTVREADGLAMSSRNAYLSPQERAAAPTLYRVITQVAEAAASGDVIAAAIAGGKAELEAAGFKVDYLDVRDAATLAPLAGDRGGPVRVLVAAWLGKTRLIDNIGVAHPMHRAL
jgi:pantoate--beta-alanine ligase